MSSVPKHAYIPFGFGQRACPGKVLSLTVGPYVLQKLTARYYFAVDEISSAKRGTLLCPHDEAKLQIRRKNQMNFGESFSVQKRI
jgi:cytochrome P450